MYLGNVFKVMSISVCDKNNWALFMSNNSNNKTQCNLINENSKDRKMDVIYF